MMISSPNSRSLVSCRWIPLLLLLAITTHFSSSPSFPFCHASAHPQIADEPNQYWLEVSDVIFLHDIRREELRFRIHIEVKDKLDNIVEIFTRLFHPHRIKKAQRSRRTVRVVLFYSCGRNHSPFLTWYESYQTEEVEENSPRKK